MTKTIASFIAVVTLVAGLSAQDKTPAAAPNVTGTWNMGLQGGHVIPVALTLDQHGRKVTGVILMPTQRAGETNWTTCARSSGASRSSKRSTSAGAARATRRAGWRPRLVFGARPADVRPPGAGVRVGHHTRVRAQARARQLQPHKRVPFFIAGRAGGALPGGLHLNAPPGTALANVMLSLLHTLGLEGLSKFGDSTAPFDLTGGTAPAIA